jgi:hypothetical protein
MSPDTRSLRFDQWEVSMDSQLRRVRTSTPQGAATAVVFVHGFGGDVTDTWQDFPQLLAK